jgi:phospholipid/cholesterol/gamma-HCH transport system permease protein
MSVRESIERLGGRVLDVGDAARGLWSVFASTLVGTFRGGRPKGEVVKQMYQIGNRSLLFVGVTLGFIGMVMTYQTCLQINRVTGDLSQIGPEFIKILVHDLSPTLTAMMLATRVGAGIAAEVGSMKVTEQVDALRMSGVAPVDYLIVPRFLASIIMTVVLTVFGAVVAYVAGGLTAHASFGLNPEAYYDLSRVNFTHLGLGLSKSLAYGAAIPIISGFCGLRAKGSSEGVGWATTAAVLGSSLAVILIDFVISGFGFLVLGESLT